MSSTIAHRYKINSGDGGIHRAKPTRRTPHLPSPPSDSEKYSYFDVQRRWPFVWLFLAQACLIYAFCGVMLHTPDTALGLVCLTVMVPPVVVNLWLRIRRRRIELEDHVVLVETWRAGRDSFPSIDVFLPSCGEHPAVLANAFDSVARLEWPGELFVHVLDDADSHETAALAAHFDFRYSVRENRGEWKKAGNLIAGFESTSAEFIVVFDADFVPRSDFLWETVPYMSDSEVGVLQTAQYFDTDERVNYFARFSAALQELFFRWTQPARDSCEAAICAGTNVLYRRAAVQAAGGFAKVPLGEDVHSGLKIWVARYRTQYIPLVIAKGLAPDSWDALTNQQYRWCRSSMLLMLSSFFRDAPFTKRQRVCFWAAFLYYMSSALLPLTSMLPTLIIIWFYPASIHPDDYLLVIPSLISTFLIFPLVARGWRPTIARVCTVNSFCHLFAVTDALRNRVMAWVPTGAAGAPRRTKGSVPRRVIVAFRCWLGVVQSLLWAGIVHGVVVGDARATSLWPALALAVWQLVMLAPVAISRGPRPDDFDDLDVQVAAATARRESLIDS